MPRLSDRITDCALYFYETEDDAREGSEYGGCGFLTHVTSEVRTSAGYVYAVTNAHVIDDGFTAMRASRKDGGIDTIETVPEAWFSHPDGDDIAVLPLETPVPTLARVRWWSVPTRMFVTRDLIDAYNIGIGDEAFMVGRLIAHDGRQKNAAVVRFGNISLMADPLEKLRHKNGEFEGFLVECRSLSGFSGSPVFVMTSQVYRGESAQRLTMFQIETEIPQEAREQAREGAKRNIVGSLTLTNAGPWLLGVDWGHMPLYRTVERLEKPDVSLRVELNTGIACIAPAWKIMDALNVGDLMKQRQEGDRRLKEPTEAGE